MGQDHDREEGEDTVDSTEASSEEQEVEEAEQDTDLDPDDLPNGCTPPPQVLAALEQVLHAWPKARKLTAVGSKRKLAEATGERQGLGEHEELEGAALLRMAHTAWSCTGEGDQQASELARSLLVAAESRFIVPCLTSERFGLMFRRMATARAASAAARQLLKLAQHSIRKGDVVSAANSLADCCQTAASGCAAEDRQEAAVQRAAGTAGSGGAGTLGVPHGAKQAAPVTAGNHALSSGAMGSHQCEGCGTGAAGVAVRRAAAQALKLSSGEVSELVLAPRCCIEARLRLAQLLLLDPADQQDLATAEALLVRSLELVEAATAAAASASSLEDLSGPTSPLSIQGKDKHLQRTSQPVAPLGTSKEGNSKATVGAASTVESGLEAVPLVGAGCAVKLRSLEQLGKAALSKLCMLLCQEGRDEEAQGFLTILGCRYRLAKGVLHYQAGAEDGATPAHAKGGGVGAVQPDLTRTQEEEHVASGSGWPTGKPTTGAKKQKAKQTGVVAAAGPTAPSEEQVTSTSGAAAADAAAKFVQAVDGAIPDHIMSLMQVSFAPTSPFWSEHGYNQDSPYFSYLHPLEGTHPHTTLDEVLHHIRKVACRHFPAVAEAKFAEWWAHCRPHGSGHQMHFDSDNEGVGEVRNPIVSTVLYLTGSGIGGPTLVTDQAFSSTQLAAQGWMVHPAVGRLTMFDGSVLHGVVPGRGPSPRPGEHRVTFMVAFWRDIRVRHRPDGLPGASQPFPLHVRGKASHPDTSAQSNSAGGDCGLPGPECFATSMRPVWEHTWPAAFQLCNSSPRQVAACGIARDDGVKVAARLVQPVWEAINPTARNAVHRLKGLPQYHLCFQGF